MRLGVITDIHGNREALDAVLDHMARRNVEALACLGDIVGYGADPAYCVDQMRDLASHGAIILRGNHDHAIGTPSERMNPTATTAIDWTRNQLDASQKAFLAALPYTARIGPVLFVHANAWAPEDWGYILSAREAERSILRTDAGITLCGHTHVPALYHCGHMKPAVAFTPVAGVETPLTASTRWLAVIGSVGQPRDGRSAAAAAILDLDQRSITFERIAYDIDEAARKIRAAGLPASLAERLFKGG